MHKLYCYVDENGQDSLGRIFVVAIAIADEKRDELLKVCLELEQTTGKGKAKWRQAKHDYRMAYLQAIFAQQQFKGMLRYSSFADTRDYDTATVVAIARAIHARKRSQEQKAIVYVDGLSKNKRHKYSTELRKLGIRTQKVQGVLKDESNPLIRLADALAGFIRDALDGDTGEIRKLFRQAQQSGMLVAD